MRQSSFAPSFLQTFGLRGLFILSLLLWLGACARYVDEPIPQPPMQQVEQTKPKRQVERWRAEQQAQPRLNQKEEPGQREVKIALMLPLSGPAAGLGQQMMDAAMLALEDKQRTTSPAELKQTQVIVLPKDTPQDARTAQISAQSAIKEGADIFLGPLFSNAVEVVEPLARGESINIISFSNNQRIAGPGVYLMGFLPEQQIKRIVDYTAQQGIRRYAALLPDDDYGRAVAASLKENTRRHGGDAVAVMYYPPFATNVDAEVKRLLAAASAQSSSALQALPPSARSSTPAYGFQALLIPEGGNQLNVIAQALRNQKVDTRQFMLLGSGQWDDASTAKDPLFEGALFASADPDRLQRYISHYRTTYGTDPDRLTSLAYDAMALALTLAYSPTARSNIPSNQLFSADKLTHPVGFNGPVDGIFRFRRNGIPERGLAVLKVTGATGKTVVDAAPRSFR